MHPLYGELDDGREGKGIKAPFFTRRSKGQIPRESVEAGPG